MSGRRHHFDSTNSSACDYNHSRDNNITAYTGLALFGSLALVSAVCLGTTCYMMLRTQQSLRMRRAFFLCMFFGSLLDLPRYVFIASSDEYQRSKSHWARACYSCHLISSCIFFVSFSLVVCMWTGVFQQFSFRLLRPKQLALVNAIFTCFAVATSDDGANQTRLPPRRGCLAPCPARAGGWRLLPLG
jgi:hypothetical protein